MKSSKGSKRYLFAGTALACAAIAFGLAPMPISQTGELIAIVRNSAPAQTIADLAYDIAGVRAGERDVPHVFLASLPADLATMQASALRKDMFVAMILPLVLRANDEIAANRARLMEIIERVNADAKLAAEDRLWLIAIGERYHTDPSNLAELARRIDVVPPSLALAQAVEESGWGTSRFAHQGNALFGQRASIGAAETEGLAPSQRGSGENFRVRAYGDLGEAVRSYTHNLNTHAAYARFRAERARRRAADKPLDGHDLAGTLLRYSERGDAYVQTLRQLIRSNRLADFDKARLGDPFAEPASKPAI